MKKVNFILSLILFLLLDTTIWATIKYNPTSPKVGQNIMFYLTSTNCNNIGENYLIWDFGDGSTKRGKHLARVIHKYRKSGIFTVKVRTQTNFTTTYQNPCRISKQITVRIATSSSSGGASFNFTHGTPNNQSQNKVTNFPITDKISPNKKIPKNPISSTPKLTPKKPITTFTPPKKTSPARFKPANLKVKIKVLKAVKRTQQAEINLKLQCQGRNLHGEIRVKKLNSHFPLRKKNVSLWAGQFKTISLTTPISPNDKKLEILVLDEDKNVIAKKVVEISIPKPNYFIIAGFKFSIDQAKNRAIASIPIYLGNTAATAAIAGSTGSTIGVAGSVATQYGTSQLNQNIVTGSGSSGSTGSVIIAQLNRIGFNNFRLDSHNRVITGQFDVNINKFVFLSNAGNILLLKKITFTPANAKAYFELQTAPYFSPKKIQLSAYLNPSSANIRLNKQGIISLTNSNNPSARFQITKFQLMINNRQLKPVKISGNFYLPDGSNFIATASLKTKSHKDNIGFIIEISSNQQENNSIGIGNFNVDLSSINIQPLWMKSITSGGLQIFANSIKIDWSEYDTLRGCRKNDSWMGILLGKVGLRLPANIMSNTPWLDLPYEGVWLPYSSLNQCCEQRFFTRNDINIPLISPKGVDLVIKSGSYIKISRNAVTENGLKGGLLLPKKLKTSTGKRIPVLFEGNLNEDLSVNNEEIVIPMPFTIEGWNQFKILTYARARVTITDSSGIIRFTNGDLIYTKIHRLNASVQGLVIDGSGFHGTASTSGRAISSNYAGYPIKANSFSVTINNYNFEDAVIAGRIQFPFLDNIERNFQLYLLMQSMPMIITKSPGDRKFQSSFFDIDPKRGMIIYYQGTPMSNILSDVNIHLYFGIANTFTDVNLGIGPTGISPAEMTIGGTWDFDGMPAQIDSAKLYSEDDKILLEVHAVFGLGSDWMSFPLSIPIKFFANGDVSGVSGEGSVNIEMEGFKFSGSANMSVDTAHNFFFEGQGKLYLIDKKVGIDSYFTYNHRKTSYDYWRVSAKVTGLKVPIGHGMYIRGFAGGFAWNMKGTFDVNSLTFSYAPQNNSYGLEAAVDMSTENDYLLYTRGLLSIQLSGNGSSGMVAFAGKGWVFDRKHNGNPEAKVTMWGTWGTNLSLMASIQAHIKVPYIVEMPGQGGYGIVKMFINKNGVDMIVGTQSNPWSIKLLETISGSGYIHTRIWTSQIVSKLGYRIWVDASGKQKIKYTNCYLKARIYGNLQGDAIINLYPNPRYHETGTVDLAVGIMACNYGVDIGAGVKKIVNAPNPLQFIVGVDASIDLGFKRWHKFIGIDILKPVNSAL